MATFILVHGTFTNSADWPALQLGLAQVATANGEHAHIEQIHWTGRNRAAAREAAASAISETVQVIRSERPKEKILIIGHSHGGSAIVYFLKNYYEAASGLNGCAFLSTPFVAIRPRKNAPLLFVVLLYFLGTALLILGDLLNSPGIVGYTYYPFVTLSAFLLFAGLFYSNLKKSNYLVEQVIRQQTADIPKGHYLFLRCSGDEAAAALSAAQFIAWLGMKAFRLLQFLIRPIVHSRSFAIGVLANVFALIILSATTKLAFTIIIPDLAGINFMGFVSSLIEKVFQGEIVKPILFVVFVFIVVGVPFVFFMCVVAALMIFIGQALTTWAFGWTGLVTGLLVELAIEPLPFGAHSLVHINWSEGTEGLDTMVHSWTYAHPLAIGRLQEWVKSALQVNVG